MTDTDIIVMMGKNPEKGFKMLMASYKQSVYWHIRRLVVTHDDAQDVMQETFVRIFLSITSFKGNGTLAAWIYRIATNESLRLLNCRKEVMLGMDSTEANLERLMTDEYVDYSDLEAIKLQKAILSLPTKQQLAFNLRYYDELTYDEIAQVMEITSASAKTNYHIAKEKIVEYITTHK